MNEQQIIAAMASMIDWIYNESGMPAWWKKRTATLTIEAELNDRALTIQQCRDEIEHLKEMRVRDAKYIAALVRSIEELKGN